MRTLVIDTATPAMTLALWDEGELTARCHEVIGRGHAERLVPELALLPECGRAERIVVGVGPGSFTGIRVGVAAARALGLAWDAPVVGLPTLALLAAQATGGEPVMAAIPGGHGEAFVQSFAGEPLLPTGAPAAAPLDQLASWAEGWRVIAPDTLSAWVRVDQEAQVDAAAFSRVAHLADLPPTPLYGRAPDARQSA